MFTGNIFMFSRMSKRIAVSFILPLYLLLFSVSSQDLVLCIGSKGHFEVESTFFRISLFETGVFSSLCTQTGICTVDQCGICTDIPLSVESLHFSSLSYKNAEPIIISPDVFENFVLSFSPVKSPCENQLSSDITELKYSLACLRSVVLLI